MPFYYYTLQIRSVHLFFCIFLRYPLNISSRYLTIFLFYCESLNTHPPSLTYSSKNTLNHLSTHFLTSNTKQFTYTIRNMCHLYSVSPLKLTFIVTTKCPFLGRLLVFSQELSIPVKDAKNISFPLSPLKTPTNIDTLIYSILVLSSLTTYLIYTYHIFWSSENVNVEISK